MSLYVHPENQQLLWNITNKLPMITDFFAPYPPAHKEQWFKSVIQLFYDKYKTKQLQLNDLHQLNQETVAYIVQSIREKTQPKPIQEQPRAHFHRAAVTTPQYNPHENVDGRQERFEKKQDYFNQQFTARQSEYETMLNRPTPPEVNFREKEEDIAISNMDELIKQHMAQREQELRQYAPPPVIPNQNIQAEIIEKNDAMEEKETRQKKPVSRTTGDVITNYEEQLRKQSEEIIYLKSVVSSLSSTIETICKEMIQIKQFVDVSSSEQFVLSQH
jgi:hypothetical protein